ncbi:MAG: biotin--[acetyl-CoA-carboxylase] ligase [Candidatus Omnitrophica bacterium]|nr:biotin--[acetyl-CoA-carboxylase] ligase [Candidatus Omnitrophota bacterium]
MPNTDELVLSALKSRPGQHVSGEELSRLVGVSRTAIWKEIEKLREEGYKILAQPHAGYQLVAIPDRLLPQELAWNLATRRIGRRIHAYEETDSTMDVAHRLAAGGEPEGSVVVAEGQRCGRGRMGRRWASPKGKGIYCSILLRPPLQLSEVSRLTLMTAVAVARAIQQVTGIRAEIKWPNDVMVGSRKVAGILTELTAELNRVNTCIVGIGINVNTPRRLLPAHAASLAEEGGAKVSRIELARALFTQMDRLYEGFLARGVEPILEEWRGLAGFLGRRVRVEVQGRRVDGQAVDVDASGALLVRTDTGLIESCSAGDVRVVRER